MTWPRDAEPAGLPTSESTQAGSGLVAVVRSPVVWVLFLAGFFDGIADNWIHAAVLWAAAVAVGVDAVRDARGLPAPVAEAVFTSRRAVPRGGVVVAAALAMAYALLVGALTPYTWPDTVAVVTLGILVVALGWRGPLWPRAVPRTPARRGSGLWAAVFVAAGLWELAALLMQPTLQEGSYAHPTISYLMESVLASHVGRTVTLLAWLVLGAYLLTRIPCGDQQPAEDSGKEAGP